jgi:hypothetical protein
MRSVLVIGGALAALFIPAVVRAVDPPGCLWINQGNPYKACDASSGCTQEMSWEEYSAHHPATTWTCGCGGDQKCFVTAGYSKICFKFTHYYNTCNTTDGSCRKVHEQVRNCYVEGKCRKAVNDDSCSAAIDCHGYWEENTHQVNRNEPTIDTCIPPDP